MPTVNLPDSYDQKLAQLVTISNPFEPPTRESVLTELIDAELARRQNGKASHTVPSTNGNGIHLNADAPESLMHSKVVGAIIDGREIYRPKWSSLREQLHLIALKQLGSFGALEKASDARLRQGKYEQEGFKYLPEGDFSLQGVDANLCWAHSLKLAKVLSLPVKLQIVWRDKDGAIHPGKSATLEWSPTPSYRA